MAEVWFLQLFVLQKREMAQPVSTKTILQTAQTATMHMVCLPPSPFLMGETW